MVGIPWATLMFTAFLSVSSATGDDALLDGYTQRCLRRVWRVQQFSTWMSLLLHRLPDSDDFQEHVARAELDALCRSESAARTLAENYVGLPYD